MNCVIVFLRYSDSLEAGIKDVPVTKRYIFLPLMAMESSRVNVGTVVKYTDSRQKNV